MSRWAVKLAVLGDHWHREPGDVVSYVRPEQPAVVVTMKATREEAEGYASGLRDGLQDRRTAATRIWVEPAADPGKTAPPQSGRP